MLQQEVVFLGHIVSGEGVKPSPNNTAKIMRLPRARTAKRVKQFVGMDDK